MRSKSVPANGEKRATICLNAQIMGWDFETIVAICDSNHPSSYVAVASVVYLNWNAHGSFVMYYVTIFVSHPSHPWIWAHNSISRVDPPPHLFYPRGFWIFWCGSKYCSKNKTSSTCIPHQEFGSEGSLPSHESGCGITERVLGVTGSQLCHTRVPE